MLSRENRGIKTGVEVQIIEGDFVIVVATRRVNGSLLIYLPGGHPTYLSKVDISVCSEKSEQIPGEQVSLRDEAAGCFKYCKLAKCDHRTM